MTRKQQQVGLAILVLLGALYFAVAIWYDGVTAMRLLMIFVNGATFGMQVAQLAR